LSASGTAELQGVLWKNNRDFMREKGWRCAIDGYWTLIFGTFSSIITNEIYERRLNQ
jgi:hypothetical protein